MPAWVKASIILSLAALMLWLGTVYGEEITPWIVHLEQSVAASFYQTWWMFVGVFIVAALVALPVGALLSMAGGLLFGVFWGGLAGWLSTSVAAWVSFLVMRWWLGERESSLTANPSLTALAKRLDHHSTELLMILRIVPLVPFYLINVAAALSPMPASRYTWASIIGLMPSTFLYALVGHSLGSWMEAKAAWDQGEVLNSSLMGALVALAVLAGLSTWAARRLDRIKAKRHPHWPDDKDSDRPDRT